jgi:hypothetical protein
MAVAGLAPQKGPAVRAPRVSGYTVTINPAGGSFGNNFLKGHNVHDLVKGESCLDNTHTIP